MFCPKCGKQLNPYETACPECHHVILKSENQQSETLSQTLQHNNPLIPFIHKVKQYWKIMISFVVQHKKKFITITSIGMIFCLAMMLFYNIYDFTKLDWDQEYNDTNLTYTQARTLTLNVLAYDKKKNPITNIDFFTDNGEIKVNGSEVIWLLPKEEGTYTITAQAPSGKKIKKSVQLIQLIEEDTIAGMISIEDQEEDIDQDGLRNEEEITLGTNPYCADTDGDGLNDFYEVHISKTDPLKADTDGDGIQDGDELDLGLDPLNIDSKGDGIQDGNRKLSYTIDDEKLGITLEIEGKGNIASSTIDVFLNQSLSKKDGLLDTVYHFSSKGTIENAKVKIPYDIEKLKQMNIAENDLVLYYLNEQTKELEAVPTIVDKKNQQINVELNHFSKYVLGDQTRVSNQTKSQVLFVIDNSVSMYSDQQMIAAGYPESSGAVGNDKSFKRLTLTNKMVDMFTGNYEFGVSEFAGSYANLKSFTDDAALIKKTVNSMQSEWKTAGSGTNLVASFKKGINEFSLDENEHYILLFTDGEDTTGALSSNKSSIISSALEKNIKICIVGLGAKVDTNDLKEIATSTGCEYYNASDDAALDEIYSIIGANINYNYVDTNDDNEVDGMIMANSGFIVNRDGFSFQNFSSNKSANGHCYGMATFAMLYYQHQLPIKLEQKITKFQNLYTTIPFAAEGYDLKNTYFTEENKLYDFEITNQGLSILLNELPSDYRDRIENDTWMIKQEYYDMLSEIGATFSIKAYQGENKDFHYYQSAQLNINNDTLTKAVSKDESQLLDAIWRLYILQANDTKISFSAEPDKAFKALNKELNEGKPIVIGVAGCHAINAIKLIQDNENANQFKIEVYDNNYPSETRYIDVTRTKYNKIQLNFTAWTNEYNYSFMYDLDNDGTKEEITVILAYPNI